MVLRYLGIDPDTAGRAEYRKMAEAIARSATYITTFDNTNYLTTLPNGEVCVANTWSGDYGVAKARAAEAGIEMNLAYFVPGRPGRRPGSTSGPSRPMPEMSTTRTSSSTSAAPRGDRGLHQFHRLCQCQQGRDPAVDPAIAATRRSTPMPSAMARLYTPKPQTAEQEERDLTRAWTEIKTGG
jgi:putrescine transport system substrate-binding protein